MIPISITWFMRGPIERSSCRLQGYMIHDYLKQHGYDSRIFLAPPITLIHFPWGAEHAELLAAAMETPVVIFQNIHAKDAEQLVGAMKARGIITIHVQCDYLPHIELQWLCDYIFTPSSFLVDYFGERVPTLRILDPVEYIISAQELEQHHQQHNATRNLRLMWVGHDSNWNSLKTLRQVLQKDKYKDFKLVTISNVREADIQWNLHTVADNIRTGDIGVVPTDQGTFFEAKSQNRLTLFMGLGLPVVAGAIPAYREIMQDGVHGLFASTEAEWERALDLLREPEYRYQMAKNALEHVVPQFTIDRAGVSWVAALSAVHKQIAQAPRNPLPRLKLWWARHRLKTEANIYYASFALSKSVVSDMLRTLAIVTPYLPFAPLRIVGLYVWLVRKAVHRAGMLLGFE